MNRTAILYALASAALFGLSTPAAKLLLGSMHPAVLAGLLYCGAGIGVAVLRRVTRVGASAAGAPQVPLGRQDVRWLALAIAAGGVAGPLLMMTGLARTDAATASLLLTLEGAATALIAWFVFHENVDRRVALGMLCLIAGAGVLAWSGAPTFASVLGPLAIVGACVAWGLDNNLTRKVSLANPLQIVEWKGLVAGPVNLAIGLCAGESLPGASAVLLAALVGFFGYGVSSRALCRCASPSRCCAHGGLFLDRAVPGGGRGCDRAGRADQPRARRSGRAHGNWRLAVPHRTPRARAYARADDACASPCA